MRLAVSKTTQPEKMTAPNRLKMVSPTGPTGKKIWMKLQATRANREASRVGPMKVKSCRQGDWRVELSSQYNCSASLFLRLPCLNFGSQKLLVWELAEDPNLPSFPLR